MGELNLEEIEFLRKHIENLCLPIDYNSKSEKYEKTAVKQSEIKNKNNYKIGKKEEDLIDKNFNEIYELYNNDKEYKKKKEGKKRLKALKISHIISFQCSARKNQNKIVIPKKKFVIKEYTKILEKNQHKARNETKFEDDFSSSDSYDSELFSFENTIPKNFTIKKKKDLLQNEDNLIKFMKFFQLNQQ